jgi:hypothetical protein
MAITGRRIPAKGAAPESLDRGMSGQLMAAGKPNDPLVVAAGNHEG